MLDRIDRIAALPGRLDRIAALEALLADQSVALAWSRLWIETAMLGAAELRALGGQVNHDQGIGQTLQVPTGTPMACLAAGRLLESQGDLAQALQLYDQAQKIRPQDPLAAVWRAHALARLGRLDEADALFEGVGQSYAWPARVTRLGARGAAALARSASMVLPDDTAWAWLVEPPKPPERLQTVALVSVDGVYWQKYGTTLLQSWQSLRSSVWLHVHLMNADAVVQAQAAQLARAVGGVSVGYEAVALPADPFGPTASRMAEHRTWFACARLRVLPWWLARAQVGVVVTDADVLWRRSPDVLWAHLAAGQSAGAVRFDARTKVLWEEWYMTLAVFRADAAGRGLAAELAAYVSHFLAAGDGVWGLDQAALWSVFGKAPKLAVALPVSSVQWAGGPHHPEAVVWTGVASQQAPTAQVSDTRHICYTRNFEDVMIQRALADVAQGFYVDVGASAPIEDSNTYGLYRRGWRGVCVEPLDYGAMWRKARPDDVFVNAAVGAAAGELTLHVFNQSQQISTASASVQALWQERAVAADESRTVPVRTLTQVLDQHAAGRVIHLLSVDVEGMEREVLAGLDWQRYRPWLVVVEAVKPGVPEPSHHEWEPLVLQAGYQRVHFDGVNRFYLAHEQLHLRGRFALPPNVWDGFVMAREVALEAKVRALEAQVSATTTTKEPPTFQQMWQTVVQSSLAQACQRWTAQHGTAVAGGPFAGMRYHAASVEGSYLPKLLGTYEQELHVLLASLPARQYRQVLNIGCADGYYSVGLARLLPQSRVWACDVDARAVAATRALAALNPEVLPHLTVVEKAFTPDDFAQHAGVGVLLVMDIEGAEEALLSDAALAALTQTDLLVEVHDCYKPDLSARLMARLTATHEVRLLTRQHMQWELPASLSAWSDWERLLAVWEMRVGPTPWLWACAKQESGGAAV